MLAYLKLSSLGHVAVAALSASKNSTLLESNPRVPLIVVVRQIVSIRLRLEDTSIIFKRIWSLCACKTAVLTSYTKPKVDRWPLP